MKKLKTLARAAAALLAALLALAPAQALAQEFQKVENAGRDQVPAVPFVGYAYGFIWIAILAYVLYVARGLSRVDRELADLQRRLAAKDGGR